MAIRYIKTDNRRYSFRECWNLSSGVRRLLMIGAKLFGIRFRSTKGHSLSDTVRETQIAEEQLPSEVRARLAPVLTELQALGFHSPQFAGNPEPKRTIAVSAMLLHPSAEITAGVVYARVALVPSARETLHTAFVTVLTDGRALCTTNASRGLDPTASEKILFLDGRSVAELWRAHLKQIETPSVRAAIRPIRDIEQLWAQMEASYQEMIQERIRSGEWAWMSDAEVEAWRSERTPPPPVPAQPPQVPALAAQTPPPPPDPDGPILDELEKLQQPKQRWGLALLIFGVSLVLFIGAGWLRWNWSFALLLVPVLFLHELGHYIAMRCFRYQNLRMFFIPLFGAAVTGLRLQVPGWKKGIVALAGPVPGILIGAALAFAAWRTDEYWVRRLSQLFLVVNVFNLLPLMPLDGGRVFDALFYVRSRTAETVALVLAGMGMLALSILLSTKILMFVAIAMFVGMPHLLRMARITEELRLQGFVPDPEDSPAISTAAAKTILGGLRASLPATTPHTPKMLAQFVMSIYERLHTTPPGWAASTGLLIVHGGSAVLALLALVFEPALDRLQRKNDKIEQENPVETKLFYNCTTAPLFAGNDAHLLSNRTTIIASSPRPEELRAAFDQFSDENTNFIALTLCGQTLFITATNAPVRWETSTLKAATGPTTSTLLERHGVRWRSVLTHVRAVAPDETTARRLTVEAEDYFEDGTTARQGREITLRDLNFTRLDRGLPALLRFLCDRRCENIRYDFEPAAAGGEIPAVR